MATAADRPAGLQTRLLQAILTRDPDDKCRRVAALPGPIGPEDRWADPRSLPVPGRPERPRLVPPRQLERRGVGSPEGRARLVHAVAHIEFNAVNLALDAAYRFGGMPLAFYQDWISVAVDEARHFGLMQTRLQQMGFAYGDFPAHDGLWQMAVSTEDSCLARMALVPRVLEARGLDVTPGMIRRLQSAGDSDTVAALEIILREEVRHVEIGTRWFRYCCRQQQLDADETFQQLVQLHFSRGIKKPLNRPARLAAGFSEVELARLESLG
ncbi:MAG: ferritin-like domain-containing protein [Xanthomonadales bacterium]|nr:ferritin-like domain-containing protein [Xanthomonadales bacterium]